MRAFFVCVIQPTSCEPRIWSRNDISIAESAPFKSSGVPGELSHRATERRTSMRPSVIAALKANWHTEELFSFYTFFKKKSAQIIREHIVRGVLQRCGVFLVIPCHCITQVKQAASGSKQDWESYPLLGWLTEGNSSESPKWSFLVWNNCWVALQPNTLQFTAVWVGVCISSWIWWCWIRSLYTVPHSICKVNDKTYGSEGGETLAL